MRYSTGLACAAFFTSAASFTYLSLSACGAPAAGIGGPSTITAPGGTVAGGGCPGAVTMTLVGGCVQLTMIGRCVWLLTSSFTANPLGPATPMMSALPCG